MVIYLISSLSIFIMGTICKTEYSEKGRRYFLFYTFLILSIISGFRAYSVGTDTMAYVNLYRNISYYDFSHISILQSRYETGFLFFAKLLSELSNEPGFLLLVVSAINIGCVCIFVKRFSKNPTLSMVLYIFLQHYSAQMNIMRQALANSIIMLAFSLILGKEENTKRRYVESFALLLLAATFHASAVSSFLLYFVYVFLDDKVQNKFTPAKSIKWSIVVAILTWIFYGLVMQLVSRFLPLYAGYFNSEWSDLNYGASLLNTMVVFVFLFFGSFYMKSNEMDKTDRFALWATFFAAIFFVLSMRMEIWDRLTNYFNVYVSLLWVPAFVQRIRNEKERFFVELLVGVGSFLYMIIILTFRPEWTMVVPYVWRH